VNILVAGGFDPDPKQEQKIHDFCAALGSEIIAKGHALLNGCRTQLDSLMAEAAYTKLAAQEDPEPDKRVISYALSGLEPVHTYGTILRSRLTDWEIATESFYIPEQVREADVVVLVGGFEGTLRAANWARIARKPLLPFTGFGGAAAKIYAQELNAFDEKYRGLVDRLEYEQLNSVKAEPREHAVAIVALAEKVAESRSVIVIMSYVDRPDLVDAYDSFQQVAEELGYECDRVTEENTQERIVPEILSRIERAAFAIVDLTDLRPNVFYELGYADGLKKKVVVTAKLGTDLPFDVKDVPTIFWESQKKLKDDLKARIRTIVKSGVGGASTPLG
jgi:nucleoside 2-deoxyribosyltransferase